MMVMQKDRMIIILTRGQHYEIIAKSEILETTESLNTELIHLFKSP